MKNKVELLAPAGDLERLKIALRYGADAVYIGGPNLNLRANAINFTFDEIKEGVKYAHSLNKKVYVTVNILLHNEELSEIENYLKEHLEPVREKRKHYVEHPEEVKQILEEGTAKAKAKATETVKNVKKAMKLDY